MDLFLRGAADRIGTDDALTKVDALMNWRAFGPILHRAWYFGQAKTHAQLAMAAISQNLLKAANKIKITPKAHNAVRPKKHHSCVRWQHSGPINTARASKIRKPRHYAEVFIISY